MTNKFFSDCTYVLRKHSVHCTILLASLGCIIPNFDMGIKSIFCKNNLKLHVFFAEYWCRIFGMAGVKAIKNIQNVSLYFGDIKFNELKQIVKYLTIRATLAPRPSPVYVGNLCDYELLVLRWVLGIT